MAEPRRALVTGASGGAGGGVLAAFLDEGWRVAGVTRRDQPAEPPGVAWIRADIRDAPSAETMVAQAVDALGGLDALVCLAGGFASTPLDRLSWSDFEAQLASGLRPTVEAVLASLPHLREADGGCIVTIGAQAAAKPGRNAGPYAAVKSATATWTISLAAGLRPSGVRANCVLPGTLDTEANRASMPDAKRDAWVTPRELGGLIVYLSSPASRPMTGAAIPIG
jgi:NAD(P)-dependent dehydrogenase (short-subunit alcohol dehydrogenase family)